MIGRIVGSLILVAILGSCATLTKYEPINENDSLVIGQIQFQCINFDFFGPISVNGNNIEGVEVKINDLQTGEQKKAISRKDGVFIFYNLDPSHQYQITELYYRKTNGNATADAILYPGTKYNFSPVIGKVKSIGAYKGFLDKSTRKGSLEKIENDVAQAFRLYYKDSKWNSYQFIN